MDVYREYNCAVNRVGVKQSHYREEQHEADRLERDLTLARVDLEEARRRLSKAENRVRKLTKDLKIQRTGYDSIKAKFNLHYDIVCCFTRRQSVHAAKLELRGQLVKRVPESLFRQVESAVERAYYEMRAEDGSVEARNRMDGLSAAAIDDKEAEH